MRLAPFPRWSRIVRFCAIEGNILLIGATMAMRGGASAGEEEDEEEEEVEPTAEGNEDDVQEAGCEDVWVEVRERALGGG